MGINPKPKPPMPGGEYTHISDSGPQPLPPGVPRVNLIPVGDGGPGPLLPSMFRRRKPKPVLPTPEEITRLPRGAQAALAARCAERVRPIAELASANGSASDAVAEAAVAILRVASHPGDLAYIRRDFSRLRHLARANQWTDETVVPPDVFGPLWLRRVPKWARISNEPQA